ncbi:MAG: bifunctional phosphopantothenoylcysteine decarboxylase/phosphopantothenate--cysteine ligase CoaBC [Bryobacterales bacterium]|jgi:phosphopantothenoylcysteine decarboxylase/phosphopantothenate--cysteine ligase|nr:bifunctional phosphopantothenoylcysteine decarboxylase/phosphopantothenate--cysteine ligase CoaBC [Bryobacterales bacterium]
MRVALGVSGGIAAYKAAELARLLMEDGHSVQCVLTSSAQEFIRPLTFAALTGRKVITDLFHASSGEDVLASAVEHIAVAQENDVLLVAPATAGILAKFAHGLADDFLSTLYLAFEGPVVVAPAMNTAMWGHAATQTNLAMLAARGHVVVDPGVGHLACGTVGPGRLAEPAIIAAAIQAIAHPLRDLAGEVCLITAGPTQEPLDPVRYLTNRSSGKMGYALASAAHARGARVILVSGPVDLPAPEGVERVRVRTAQEMRDAVMQRLPESTIIIKAAAVADFQLEEVPRQKVKKTSARFSLELVPTPDILAEVGSIRGERLLVGFAAETQNLEQEARRKLESKRCDMVVANLVGGEGVGFESDDNEVLLVTRRNGSIAVPRASKLAVSHRILEECLKLRLVGQPA